MESIENLYSIICSRQQTAAENSYTAYLFREGLDKILKKVGEEATETVIAAKNKDKDQLVSELSDLIYHLLVLMVNEEVALADLEAELNGRAQKIGNKKIAHQVDKNS